MSTQQTGGNAMSRKIIFGLCISLAGGAVLAQSSFSEMDENGDGNISKDEYFGSLSDAGIYSDWDVNSNGFVDESEFDAIGEIGIDEDFADWDADRNDYLDAGEFYDGVYNYYDHD